MSSESNNYSCDHGASALEYLKANYEKIKSTSGSSAPTAPVTVNMKHLLSACLDAAERACEVIRLVYSSGELNVIDKASASDDKTKSIQERSLASLASVGVSMSPGSGASANYEKVADPQTIADLKSQQILMGCLRSTFPGLKLIGEESEEEVQNQEALASNNNQSQVQGQGHLQAQVEDPKINFNLIDSSLNFPEYLLHVPLSDIVVWVDPLDGTKEFTIGNVEGVTVLLGIAVKGVAVAGVIASPFLKRSVYGCLGVGYYGGGLDSEKAKESRRLQNKNRVVVTSRSHHTPALQALLDTLKPDSIIRTGGAGVKGVMLLDGRADAYVFPQIGTKKWDVCAVDACIHSAGGCCTDGYGVSFNYLSTTEFDNSHGILATNDVNIHKSYTLSKTDKIAKF